jgi:hypothetical protein
LECLNESIEAAIDEIMQWNNQSAEDGIRQRMLPSVPMSEIIQW